MLAIYYTNTIHFIWHNKFTMLKITDFIYCNWMTSIVFKRNFVRQCDNNIVIKRFSFISKKSTNAFNFFFFN